MENRRAVKLRSLCQSGIIAAILIAVQVALRVIPNVEAVTVIIIVCAVTFPFGVVFPAVLAFCTGEWLIYGFGYWVVAYYIYWPLLALACLLLKLVEKPLLQTIAATLIAAVMTTFFGVLTSAIDACFAVNSFKLWRVYFPIVYVRGAVFYITHIVSNTVVTALLFLPLTTAMKNFRRNEKISLPQEDKVVK